MAPTALAGTQKIQAYISNLASAWLCYRLCRAFMKKRRYLIVGTGGRAPMFLEPIFEAYRDSAELVGMCDTSPTRMEFHRDSIRKINPKFDCPQFAPEAFNRMVRKLAVDTVIICSPDWTHDEYIVKSVKLGCDVICEKPIAIDARKVRRVRDAIQQAGRNVRVAFNYRWSPGVTRVRRLIDEGAIGSVKHVSMDYLLNTRHGADYFRRWHARMELSGGLLVHKSTHHFDLVNWWINGIPESVFAHGDLTFYGKSNAIQRGDESLTNYERYTGTASESDPFRLDLTKNPNSRRLYLEAEADNGYVRDRNVFRDDINIYDTMSVLVKYRSGISLTYSLNAFCPYEGFHVRIVGDRGMIEYSEHHASHVILGQSTKALASEQEENVPPPHLVLHPHFKEPVTVEIDRADGSHGGGDPLLQEQIFSTHPPSDPFHRNAGHEQGIASAIIGIAANRSIKTRKSIPIGSLCDFGPDATLLSDLI